MPMSQTPETPETPDSPEMEAGAAAAAEEPTLELVAEEEAPYPWTDDLDEMRRCFVLEHIGSSEIEGRVLIENMHMVFEWLKTGQRPAPTSPPRGRMLKSIDKGAPPPPPGAP